MYSTCVFSHIELFIPLTEISEESALSKATGSGKLHEYLLQKTLNIYLLPQASKVFSK